MPLELVLEHYATALSADGGWASVSSPIMVYEGILWDQPLLWETPAMITLSKWLKTGKYSMNVESLDQKTAGIIKSGIFEEPLLWILCIGPIRNSHALWVHSRIRRMLNDTYKGSFVLTKAPPIGTVARQLHLTDVMEIRNGRCCGWRLSDSFLERVRLQRA